MVATFLRYGRLLGQFLLSAGVPVFIAFLGGRIPKFSMGNWSQETRLHPSII